MGIGNQRLVIDRATGRLGGNLAHAHQLSEVAFPPKEFVAVDDAGGRKLSHPHSGRWPG